MFYYYFFFGVISLFSGIEFFKNKRVLKLVYLVIAAALICLAGLKGEGVSRDDSNYVQAFNEITSFNAYITDYSYWSFFEPLFYYVVFFIKNSFSSYVIVAFSFFAITAGLIKYYLIYRSSRYIFMTLLIYFTTFFFMHDMTQIRASTSVAFFLLGLYNKSIGNYKTAICCALISFGFHYSAIVTIPAYFLNDRKINVKAYTLLIGIGLIFVFININFFQLLINLNIPVVSEKLSKYSLAMELGLVNDKYEINVFNKVFLMRLGFCLFLLWFSTRRVIEGNVVFLKMYSLSIFIFLVMSSDTSGMAYRISEIYGISEMFVLPLIIDMFKNKLIGYAIIFLFCFTYFINELHFEKLVQPYFFSNSF